MPDEMKPWTPRLSNEHLDEVQGLLNAYRSSKHQAPVDLLFAAADAIGALRFDIIDLTRHTPPPPPTEEEVEAAYAVWTKPRMRLNHTASDTKVGLRAVLTAFLFARGK